MKEKQDNYRVKPRGTFCILPQRAVLDKRLQHRPKTFLTFCCLCNYANRTGLAFPNQLTMAKDLGVTQSNISRHIKLLIEYGYVRYASKKGHKNLKGNRYFIVFDEEVTEQHALSIQTAKDMDSIEEPVIHTQGPKTTDKEAKIKPINTVRMSSDGIQRMSSDLMSNRDYNTRYKLVAKDIINEYKKKVESTYGHTIIYKLEHIALVEGWLANGYTKEYLNNRIANMIDYRASHSLDSIKSIAYFKSIFTKGTEAKAPQNDTEQLNNLIKKFTNTHKIR
jgi:DNA-binding transcriptional regulator GbsR (MarR family)